MPGGRPSEYTAEKADEICALIATDSRISVKAIGEMEDMPCASTIFKWLRENAEFAESYARAKADQAELLVDEMLTIADDGELDRTTRINRAGEEYQVTDQDVIQRSKLMVDTRKWIASKLKPKKYGDRVEQHHTSDGKTFTGLTILGPKDK